MCTAINYLHALEKEIELRLNGYQTCVAVPDYIGPKEYTGEFGTYYKYIYEINESDRTNASFEDISRSFEKAIECYQVPEQEVPKAQLLPENLLSIFTSEVQFDSITKKKRLCLALNKKIKDARLIQLIQQFLKAGYLEDWTYHRTYSGTPQGGIISPILANIYLHELDKFVENLKEEFDKPSKEKYTPEYQKAKYQKE